MANYCSNLITINGDPELIKIIATDYIGLDENDDSVEFTFEWLVPIPEEVQDDSYYWRINNWGNKWCGDDAYVEIDDTQIYISVDTAWSPCDKWTYKLIEMCPAVNIYHEYFEPGCAFIGWIEHSHFEGPDEYNECTASYSDNPYEYWMTVFEKEYESFDWLYELVEDSFDCEDITEEDKDELIQLIEIDAPLETVIQTFIEKGVL